MQIGLLLIFAVIGVLVALIAQFYSAKAAVGFAKELTDDLYRHILSLPKDSRDRLTTSSLVTRLTSDTYQIQTGINQFLRLFLRAPIIVFGAIFMAYRISAELTFWFLVTYFSNYLCPNYRRGFIMQTQEEMNVLVPEKLAEIERDYGVRVLWAIESGSRAWDFESPDSDFDVRFIYKHKQDFYLRLNEQRDVIELPIDDTWDVSGWDLDKTLKLLYKSNPTLFEWLQSPIVYQQTDFIERIRPLANQYFSEKKMLYHYLNTARTQMNKYLSGDKVKPKKYFYALRPILACRWIEKYHSVPPILFDDLVKELLPDEMKEHVSRLLDIKVKGPEGMEIDPIMPIQYYIIKNIKELDAYVQSVREEKKDWKALNQFFLEELGHD